MHADLHETHLFAVMIGVIVVGPIIMWALVQIANKRCKKKRPPNFWWPKSLLRGDRGLHVVKARLIIQPQDRNRRL